MPTGSSLEWQFTENVFKIKKFSRPCWVFNFRPPTCQASMPSITPTCLVRVKGVKGYAYQQSMSNHLAVGSEFKFLKN